MKPNLIDIDIYDRYLNNTHYIKKEYNILLSITIILFIFLILYLFYDKKKNNRVTKKDFYYELNNLIKNKEIPIHVPINIETNEYGKLPIYDMSNKRIESNTNNNNYEFTENDDTKWF
jgi:hypothetical protein